MSRRSAMSTTLSAHGLTLRPISIGDERGIALAGADAAIQGLPWFGSDFQAAWALDWIKRAEAEWAARGSRTWSILDEAGHYVGSVVLLPEREGAIEIAYWVLPNHRGTGVATRAVGAALAWARRQFPAARVWAKTRLDNVASQRVLVNCGFRERGRAKLAYFDLVP